MLRPVFQVFIICPKRHVSTKNIDQECLVQAENTFKLILQSQQDITPYKLTTTGASPAKCCTMFQKRRSCVAPTQVVRMKGWTTRTNLFQNEANC